MGKSSRKAHLKALAAVKRRKSAEPQDDTSVSDLSVDEAAAEVNEAVCAVEGAGDMARLRHQRERQQSIVAAEFTRSAFTAALGEIETEDLQRCAAERAAADKRRRHYKAAAVESYARVERSIRPHVKRTLAPSEQELPFLHIINTGDQTKIF
ncbi:MAG: hypothetical protein SGPRY_012641 [Prymnesium sp.]